MTPKSMTGFGRAEGQRGATAWVWEVRSVNGRGLDIRLKTPPGLDALEPRVRDLVQARLARGSLNLTLTMRRTQSDAGLRLNEVALQAVLAAARQAQALAGPGATVSVDGLLGLRGVLDVVEDDGDDAEVETRAAAILTTLDDAITALILSRRAEGARLAAILAGQLDEIERCVADVAAAPSRTPERIAARLAQQVARLTSVTGATFDPVRLHQEAVLIATRIDVTEELARLKAHVAAARELLAAREPVGRKLDFLTQEFNRETNTLCSKGNDLDVTRPGLALKSVIDQMREQVQNIE
jgi:uncharacterized protein (TIGR00255 family)